MLGLNGEMSIRSWVPEGEEASLNGRMSLVHLHSNQVGVCIIFMVAMSARLGLPLERYTQRWAWYTKACIGLV